MATKYVNSGASGANNGTSWTDAWTALSSATGVSAGDVVLIASTHSENIAAGTTYNFSLGTWANPIKLISANTGTSAYESGASILTSSASYYDLTLNGNIVSYGVTWGCSGRFNIAANGGEYQEYVDCTWKSNKSDAQANTTVGIRVGTYTPSYVRLVNHTFDFGSVTSAPGVAGLIRIQAGNRLEINKLAITPPSSDSVPLFTCEANSGVSGVAHLTVREGDLSSIQRLCDAATSASLVAHFSKCKVHASYTLASGTMTATGHRFLLDSSDDGTITVSPLGLREYVDYFGTVKATLSVYRTNGANDGQQANAYAREMVSSANALEVFRCLAAPPLTRWVAPDASISGATGKGIFTSTRCGPTATPTALTTDGTSTWNGTGVGTKQKISVTLTNASTLTVYVAGGATLNDDDFWIEVHEPDQVGGPTLVVCCLAKPSTTVYVDPRLEVA